LKEEEKMISKEITIRLENGLEARPVAMLVQVASKFDSSVYLEAGEKKVNAKSIMGMMSLGLDTGEKVTVIVDGADEAAALEDIEKYLSGK
jgi:catabolite repression HPr-like protein